MRFNITNIRKNLLKVATAFTICSLQLRNVKGDSECEILRDIYNGFFRTTEEWKRGSNDCCNIGGIKCNLDYKIYELNFTSHNLSGQLSERIGNLTSLQTIDLSNNNIYGVIPKTIGQLTNLVNLVLNNNQFSGRIPRQVGSLKKLQLLNLGNNGFYDFLPSTLGDLINLKQLYVENNKISGVIPTSLSILNSLESIDLSGNEQLTGSVPTMNSIKTCNYNSTSLCISKAERCKSTLGECNEEIEGMTNKLLKDQNDEEKAEEEREGQNTENDNNFMRYLYEPYVFIVIIFVIVLIILLIIYCVKGYIKGKYEAEVKKARDKRQIYANSSLNSISKYQEEERYRTAERETDYFSNGEIPMNSTILSGSRNYRPYENPSNNYQVDYESFNSQYQSQYVSPVLSSPVYNVPTSQLAGSNEYVYMDPGNGESISNYNANSGVVYMNNNSGSVLQVARQLQKVSPHSQISGGQSPIHSSPYNRSNEDLYLNQSGQGIYLNQSLNQSGQELRRNNLNHTSNIDD